MPKLWNDTIEAHRREVRDAILTTTAEQVARHGLASVTMSQIAEGAGIGRATLYKYFPDVESILLAWHQRQVEAHLKLLVEVRDQAGDAAHRLEAVLEAYASIQQEHQGHGHAALLHAGEHVAHAERHVHEIVKELVKASAKAGELRGDVSPDELTTFCLHALGAARELPSKAAVRRLVTLTLAAMRAPR